MISDEQTTNPLPNFRIGKTTGRRLVAEIEASRNERAHGTDGPGLFRASGFLRVQKRFKTPGLRLHCDQIFRAPGIEILRAPGSQAKISGLQGSPLGP